MVRRWIIRSFFIALCVVCVGTWVGSYFQLMWVDYYSTNHVWSAYVEGGSVLFMDRLRDPGIAGEWYWGHRIADPNSVRESYLSDKYHFAGFAYDESHQPYSTPLAYWIRDVFVPLWSPTFLSALLLWFAWRKTRLRKAVKGFPVEPTAKPI